VRLYYPSQSREQVDRWAAHFEPVESGTRPFDAVGFYLSWHEGRLVLYRGTDPHGVCLRPADVARRATLRGELARACGVTAAYKPRIVDAMAGLGVDGMTLNALGCEVVMIERHPALWALLDSFVQLHGTRGSDVVHADAWGWFVEAAPAERMCDVVYLDPMFPGRRKGALPGKSLQFVAELAGSDLHHLAAWIELGKRHARSRVVLKRRLRDPLVVVPDWQIRGRSVRYDIYRAGSDAAPRSTA